MRTLIIFVTTFFILNVSYAQKSLQQFYHRYSEVENVNKITLEGGLLKLISTQSDESNGKQSMAKLEKLSAIWMDEFNPISKKEVNQLLRGLRKDHYEDLFIMKEGTSNVNFLVRENGKYITGVILIIDDVDKFLLVNLKGNFIFEDLKNIDIDIEGMEHFKKLPKDRSKLKRA